MKAIPTVAGLKGNIAMSKPQPGESKPSSDGCKPHSMYLSHGNEKHNRFLLANKTQLFSTSVRTLVSQKIVPDRSNHFVRQTYCPVTTLSSWPLGHKIVLGSHCHWLMWATFVTPGQHTNSRNTPGYWRSPIAQQEHKRLSVIWSPLYGCKLQ